jgi:hypothetical protein
MAVKNEFLTWNGKPTMNIKNIWHEKIVTYSNSAACKIGTKTMGQSMTNVTFKDIDIIAANRAMVIDAFDNALIDNTVFQDIRVENTGILISVQNNQVPSWRTAVNQSVVKNTYFTNIASDVKKSITLQGKSAQVNLNGVHFSNFTVAGKPVTSRTDADAMWNINANVSNITFNTVTGVAQDQLDQKPEAIRVYRTNSGMTIDWAQSANHTIGLQIYNPKGILESEHEISPEPTGQYTIPLRSTSTGRILSPGLYICKLSTKQYAETFNLVVAR